MLNESIIYETPNEKVNNEILYVSYIYNIDNHILINLLT